MLRDGAAVVFSMGEVPASLQAAEASARSGRRGLWAQPGFVLTPQEAASHIGEFHVIEGVVTRVYEAKTVTYLNFGARWQEDFSVRIGGRARKEFPTVTAGQKLRVRGTLMQENGPMLKLSSPSQLERF